jgi:transcriptional regulator with XRE-family HTH domain
MRQLRENGLVENAVKLGEHLKNRRLNLGLTQAKAAARLGVLREVYDRWERCEREPVVSVWPNIIAFLGYYPCHPVTSSASVVLMIRRVTGLDQKALARRVGVIHQELRHWERGKEQPNSEKRRKLKDIAEAATRQLQDAWPSGTRAGATRGKAGAVPVDGPSPSGIIPV